MLKVKKSKYDFGLVIAIDDGENELDILFGGNGDLYFSPKVKTIEMFDKEDPIVFTINEEDVELYNAFNHLYNKIVNYEPFDIEENNFDFGFIDDDSDYYREYDRYREYPLVSSGIISWRSDEEMVENASVLNISKLNNNIILEFVKNKPEDSIYMTYSIRFRNSGSSYDPFNCRFMELYQTLCQTDFDYHQITIDEYLKEKNKVKVYK